MCVCVFIYLCVFLLCQGREEVVVLDRVGQRVDARLQSQQQLDDKALRRGQGSRPGPCTTCVCVRVCIVCVYLGLLPRVRCVCVYNVCVYLGLLPGVPHGLYEACQDV